MRCSVLMISLLAALGAPFSQAAAQDARIFKPSSVWALDYGDDYCRLMRDFSDGDRTVGLFVERTQPGPLMRLIVIGDGVRLFRGSQQIGYRMHPAGAPRTVQRLRSETSDGQQYLNLGPTMFADAVAPAAGSPPAMPPPYSREAEIEAARAISGIYLDRGLAQPVLLETGELAAAAQALQTCADDLIASWGLDPEKHKNLTRPAMPAQPTAGWISADTVPFTEFAKLGGGNNEVRVMIDATGKATSCHIQWPSIGEAINARICSSVVENSSFLPALDNQGQGLDSYWIASVFFLMPPFGGP